VRALVHVNSHFKIKERDKHYLQLFHTTIYLGYFEDPTVKSCLIGLQFL